MRSSLPDPEIERRASEVRWAMHARHMCCRCAGQRRRRGEARSCGFESTAALEVRLAPACEKWTVR